MLAASLVGPHRLSFEEGFPVHTESGYEDAITVIRYCTAQKSLHVCFGVISLGSLGIDKPTQILCCCGHCGKNSYKGIHIVCYGQCDGVRYARGTCHEAISIEHVLETGVVAGFSAQHDGFGHKEPYFHPSSFDIPVLAISAMLLGAWFRVFRQLASSMRHSHTGRWPCKEQ